MGGGETAKREVEELDRGSCAGRGGVERGGSTGKDESGVPEFIVRQESRFGRAAFRRAQYKGDGFGRPGQQPRADPFLPSLAKVY